MLALLLLLLLLSRGLLRGIILYTAKNRNYDVPHYAIFSSPNSFSSLGPHIPRGTLFSHILNLRMIDLGRIRNKIQNYDGCSCTYVTKIDSGSRPACFLSLYGSTALWTLAAFSVPQSYTMQAGLLGRGISPSQDRYLYTEQQKQE
jgi:hypothetical protein